MAAVAGSAAAVLTLGSPASAGLAEWPSAGGGEGNTYWNEDETVIGKDTVGDLEQKFHVQAPKTVTGEPVVVDDKIILPYDGGVAAYSDEGGSKLWDYELNQGGVPDVASADGNLYVAASELGKASQLVALDGDGKNKWTKVDEGVDFDTLVAGEGEVMVSGTNREHSKQRVLAFDSDGTPAWHKDGYTIPNGSELIDRGGQVYLRPWTESQAAERTTAVAIGSGTENWTIDRAIEPRSSALKNSFVAMEDTGVGDHHQLSVSSRDGSINWNVPTAYASSSNTLAVDDSHSYLAERHSQKFIARDLKTGKTAWTAPIEEDNDTGSPIVANGLAYLTSVSGTERTLTAYDAETGERVWSHELSSSEPTHPVVVNGSLYLVQDGELQVFRPVN